MFELVKDTKDSMNQSMQSLDKLQDMEQEQDSIQIIVPLKGNKYSNQNLAKTSAQFSQY